ncbi:MAG: hypothetical protein U9P00_07780, partial [Pseudomonadota bacterium]|nr:hypothetical protein [Pseudomonadota bacterium]
EQLEANHDAALGQWRLAAERARYEAERAERAERRYRAVEPGRRTGWLSAAWKPNGRGGCANSSTPKVIWIDYPGHTQKSKCNLFRKLVKRGVPRHQAAKAVFSNNQRWALSNTFAVVRAFPNRWFAEELGLAIRSDKRRPAKASTDPTR